MLTRIYVAFRKLGAGADPGFCEEGFEFFERRRHNKLGGSGGMLETQFPGLSR